MHSIFNLLMDHFRQKYTTNVQSALENIRRTAAEHSSCPVFRPSFAAGRRWNQCGRGLTLLLENRCETGVQSQQVFGGHSSSSLSGFGSSPSSSHCLLSEQMKRGGCHAHMKRIRFSLQVVFDSSGSAGMCVCFFSPSGILLGSYRVARAPWKSDYATACAQSYVLCFSFCSLQLCRCFRSSE